MIDSYMFETLQRENIELGKVIRELRQEAKITQKELFDGLCSKEVYARVERGDGIKDELITEQLLSRLHIQYRLLDMMVSEKDFWLKECRFHIDRLIEAGAFKEARRLIKKYRSKAEVGTRLQKQYLLWKEAQMLEESKPERAGKLYLQALELTMPIPVLEQRLKKTKVISEEELRMYLGYRNCIKPFSMEEYEEVLQQMEECMLAGQLYSACYFETGFSYATHLYQRKEYAKCRDFCEKMLKQLTEGLKHFYLVQFHFLHAKVRGKLAVGTLHTTENSCHEDALEAGSIREEFRMAYYAALAFGEGKTAEVIDTYCREEYGWHIMNSVK